MVVSYLGGIAARSERYMRDHWSFAKGFLDAKALRDSAVVEEAAWVAAQKAAGLGLLAPALTRWEDLLRPLTGEGTTVAPGALTRYFETNTFFRQPHVTGPFPVEAARGWNDAFSPPTGSSWILTLPSPWDFACRSRDDRAGTTRRKLALDVAAALRPVVDHAFRQGATLVRFHDPSIAYRRHEGRDVAVFAEALAAAAGSHAKDAVLHITNGDPFEVPEALEANPLGGLSLEDPGRPPRRRLQLPNNTRFTAAVVRGEESLVEAPDAIASQAQALATSVGTGLWGITNGWDLDHVPHAIALRKVEALGQATVISREVPA